MEWDLVYSLDGPLQSLGTWGGGGCRGLASLGVFRVHLFDLLLERLNEVVPLNLKGVGHAAVLHERLRLDVELLGLLESVELLRLPLVRECLQHDLVHLLVPAELLVAPRNRVLLGNFQESGLIRHHECQAVVLVRIAVEPDFLHSPHPRVNRLHLRVLQEITSNSQAKGQNAAQPSPHALLPSCN